MHITIDRAALVKALDRTTKIVERRQTIPILANVLLAADANILTVTATDLDLEARTEAAAEVHASGATTVSAHILFDIARKLPEAAQVSLALDEGGTKLDVKAGRARFTLQCLPPIDFPVRPGALEASHRFNLPVKSLVETLSQVSFAMLNEETRYYLNGILLRLLPESGFFHAVATDGHRLARRKLPAPPIEAANGAAFPDIILPRKAVNEILRLGKDGEGDAAIEVSDRMIAVTFGATRISSKLINGTYPDYERVIPQGNEKIALLDRDLAIAAADRVMAIAQEKGRSLRLEFAGGTLTLSVTDASSGNAVEEIEAEYEAAPLTIGFNARYFHEVLSCLSADTCRVALADPGSPTLFMDNEAAPLLIVLMPMRV